MNTEAFTVTFDTNFLLSYVFTPNEDVRQERQWMLDFIMDMYRPMMLQSVVDELARKAVDERFLHRKHRGHEEFAKHQILYLVELMKKTKSLPILPHVEKEYPRLRKIMRDPKDYPILADAVVHQINYFLTGDDDFISISSEVAREYGLPWIMREKAFKQENQEEIDIFKLEVAGSLEKGIPVPHFLDGGRLGR